MPVSTSSIFRHQGGTRGSGNRSKKVPRPHYLLVGFCVLGLPIKFCGCQRGFQQRRVLDLAENRSFSGSGRPLGSFEPSKKLGSEAAHLLGWFYSTPGPPTPRKRQIFSQIPNPPPRGPFKGPRGPLKGTRGPLKGPRGPLKGPRGPFHGRRGPFKGSRDPFQGPRGPVKGPPRLFKPIEKVVDTSNPVKWLARHTAQCL